MTHHTFDIIIPVYHPGESFSRLLSMLEIQTWKPGKIILMETLEEGESLTEYPGCEVHAVRKQDFDHAATRREGVSFSGAEAFLMMTDDAVPWDELLCEKLIGGLFSKGSGEKGEHALCYGRQLPGEDSGEEEKFTRLFNYPAESFVKTIGDLPRLGIKTFFASNVCCAYQRSAYDAVGGFTDHAIFNEDMICARALLEAGYSIRYEAEAKVIHSHHYTAKDQFHRNFDLGMSQAMHPEVFGGITSEGEGVKLVLRSARHLAGTGNLWRIPHLILVSAAKYAGFRLGKGYRKLAPARIRKYAMNKTFIDKYVM